MNTDYLFVAPSASRGIARIVDFWGVLSERNVSPSPEYADALATYLDWRITGEDLARATDLAVKEEPTQMSLFDDAV